MNWTALLEVPPGQPGSPRGNCESCGLYIWSDGSYKIPDRKGHYCTISCIECELFGHGKCRWCGYKVGSAKKFCNETCRNQSNQAKFGDGTRLLNYLARHNPSFYRHLTASTCKNCDDPLSDKRKGASFCTNRCKVAFHRKSGTNGKSRNNRNTAQWNQRVEAVKSQSRGFGH